MTVANSVVGCSAASWAARSAASSIPATRVTSGWLNSSRISRPLSTLWPSRRTTIGFAAPSPSSSRAPTMPLATSSQAVMPPKTLTSTLRTCGSHIITSSPATILSEEAPPPISRKFAGACPPCLWPASATMSSVDITRPAPLPMIPTVPSNLT
ncbi:conserved hypothetical protein [Corynebacterium efficiens YS-314]|uniref:Uncharacterized protein n=1 Tax=Corynebacterium efficiens (strain DSM 44549 / YS-314 / AJ 12310 / JCM 11189 / NBRC 100395) TaxID=196164 RepID=Q8FMQ2_COREF|nr:conserved hypothetical protein [Corynebacterium efficiens YS-314]